MNIEHDKQNKRQRYLTFDVIFFKIGFLMKMSNECHDTDSTFYL